MHLGQKMNPKRKSVLAVTKVTEYVVIIKRQDVRAK